MKRFQLIRQQFAKKVVISSMLMPYQFKHQAFGFFKNPTLITVTICLLLISIGQIYCYASDLDTIHTMQNIRIKDREKNNKQILTKTKAYKKLNEELDEAGGNADPHSATIKFPRS